MGHNLDLIQMFGLPEKLKCPKCHNKVRGNFEEYDIDCGNSNETPGEWSLFCYCNICENEWKYNFKIKIEEIN